MLNKIKKTNKDKKKKQNKEEDTQKKVKERAPDQEQEENPDLVEIDYKQKEEQSKVKQAPKKKVHSELQEQEIVIENAVIKQTQPKVVERTTWVANTVEEALNVKFNMDEHWIEFESLTDDVINKQIQQEKLKRQSEKPKDTIEGGILMAPLEKTVDQLKMEKMDKNIDFKPGTATDKIGFSIPSSNGKSNLNFTNSSLNDNANLVKIQKTPQQLKMEEAEQREQEAKNQAKNSTWIGTKKSEAVTPAAPTKLNPWVTATSGTENSVNDNKKVESSQPKETFASKVGPLTIDPNNGMRFAPLEKTAQQQKYERQEQQFNFVSRKEMEERRRIRQQKEALAKKSQMS